MKTRCILFIILALSLAYCSRYSEEVEISLRLAGDNRPELEKKSALLCMKTANKFGGK